MTSIPYDRPPDRYCGDTCNPEGPAGLWWASWDFESGRHISLHINRENYKLVVWDKTHLCYIDLDEDFYIEQFDSAWRFAERTDVPFVSRLTSPRL